MSTSERRKILCSIGFHLVAITCVIWSLYVLIQRTAQEIKQKEFHWPFWTKLIVVAIGFIGGLVFMYVQCKVYVQLWHRLKAYNRVIYVQNNPLSNPSQSSDAAKSSSSIDCSGILGNSGALLTNDVSTKKTSRPPKAVSCELAGVTVDSSLSDSRSSPTRNMAANTSVDESCCHIQRLPQNPDCVRYGGDLRRPDSFTRVDYSSECSTSYQNENPGPSLTCLESHEIRISNFAVPAIHSENMERPLEEIRVHFERDDMTTNGCETCDA